MRGNLCLAGVLLLDVPLVVIVHGISEFGVAVGVDEAIEKQADQNWLAEMAELATQTSQGTLVVAEESGHNIMLEQPGVVIDAIRTILAQVRGE
jgi:pimeloyl-ACP methyl ester carboxylesterase